MRNENNSTIDSVSNRASTENQNSVNWVELLQEALTMPGKISEAYSVFRGYSFGNQILAMVQLASRELAISPIASFSKWKELGRTVKKGEKALAMVMPVTIKAKDKKDTTEDSEDTGGAFTGFMLRRNWFALSQTEGQDYQHEAISPEWDKQTALDALEIAQVPFEHADGNCQGYALARTVAVSPIAALPHKTQFHELAHVVLGHTDTAIADAPNLSRCIKEAEAEATAYLICATLNLPGMEESRGYIQNWLQSEDFPEKSARRVFSAADKILKGGQKMKH